MCFSSWSTVVLFTLVSGLFFTFHFISFFTPQHVSDWIHLLFYRFTVQHLQDIRALGRYASTLKIFSADTVIWFLTDRIHFLLPAPLPLILNIWIWRKGFRNVVWKYLCFSPQTQSQYKDSSQQREQEQIPLSPIQPQNDILPEPAGHGEWLNDCQRWCKCSRVKKSH